MRWRIALVVVVVVAAAACSSGDGGSPAQVVEIDWQSRVDATRAISPLETDLFVLWEINEEQEAGHLLSGRIDFETGLADLTNSSPITSNPRNRVIVNGGDAYFLTASESVTSQLPAGTEIVQSSLDEFDSIGSVSMDPEVLTGALGLLAGVTETRQTGPQTFELELDVTAAVNSLSAAERRAMPADFDDAEGLVGIAELTLALDGETIERFRARLSGNGPNGEILVTVDYAFAPFPTPLTFDPPPTDALVDLADVPATRQAIRNLGPGF